MTAPQAPPGDARQARYRTGLRSEWKAALALRLRGYRILEKRWQSNAGEIDLIATRGRRLAFIEVKHRADVSDDEAHAALGPNQRQRIRRAADLWLARNKTYRDYEIGFDLVLVAPRRWPRIIQNGV